MKYARLIVLGAAFAVSGCSLASVYEGSFFYLESQYAFVYWDQPYSGSTQGSTHHTPFSVGLAVSATSQVVSLIKTRYHDPKIVLFGHSWGETLGTAYLLDASREAGISGWIEVDGGHNMPLSDKLSRRFVIDYGSSVINALSTGPNERIKWQSILSWYKKNPVINAGNFLQHDGYVKMAHGGTPEGQSTGPIDSLQLLDGPWDFSTLAVDNLSTAMEFIPAMD